MNGFVIGNSINLPILPVQTRHRGSRIYMYLRDFDFPKFRVISHDGISVIPNHESSQSRKIGRGNLARNTVRRALHSTEEGKQKPRNSCVGKLIFVVCIIVIIICEATTDAGALPIASFLAPLFVFSAVEIQI